MHAIEEIFFAGNLDLQLFVAAGIFEITEGGVDAHLVTELDVVSPDHEVGAGKVRHLAKDVAIEGGIWGNMGIPQDLVNFVG